MAIGIPEVIGGGGASPIIDWDPSPLADRAALVSDPVFAVGVAENYEAESDAGGDSVCGYDLVSAPASLASLASVSKAMRYSFNHGTVGSPTAGCCTLTCRRYMQFPSVLPEVWAEWWMQYSTNFSTDQDDCTPNDHKYVCFESTAGSNGRWMIYIGNFSSLAISGGHGIGVETPWRGVGSPFNPSTGMIGGYTPTAGARPSGKAPEDLWTSGIAHRFRCHLKSTTTNGIFRFYIDDTEIHNETGFGIAGDGGVGSDTIAGVSYNHNKDDGPASTLMYEDWGRWKVYNADPGWGW